MTANNHVNTAGVGMSIFIERCELGDPGGRRVAVKDSIDLCGLPTAMGSAVFEHAGPAPVHAAVVANLLAAGDRVVGKTTMHEFAFGVTGVNEWSGTAPNPRYPALITGGSSSGSAASVAAGEADYALGTDTGGSIRVPAACCGIYGFKPTFGRVSRKGVWPAESSLDCVGPFADSLALLEHGMCAIDPGFDPVSELPGAFRVGLISGLQVNPAVAAATERYLRKTGLPFDSVELPLMESAFTAGLAVINAETWTAFGSFLETGRVGADVAARLRRASETTDDERVQAESVREAFTAQVDALLETYDVLVLPCLPDRPMTLDAALAGQMDLRITSLVRPFNLSGHPALTLPLEVEDFPVGLQLVGRKHADEALFASARVFERALGRNENNDD